MSQLDRLGLRENPFTTNIDQRYFYADKNRAHILESTEHLIEYSSNFQVIIGESGMGKSHLLEVLANRIDNNWRVARISPTEQFDTLSLIQAILDSFGALTDDRAELLEVLETQLAEISQLGFKAVLFIDDGQLLSLDSLRFLMQLSQQKQDDVPYVNIVLCATTQVTELLQSPELREFRDIVHVTALDYLDKEGVSGYLRHKMAVAGFDRESPFTPRIIDSIYNDSDGIPQKVDLFADKFLASSGKAENYIEESTNDLNPEAVNEDIENDFISEQDSHLMDSLIDTDLAEHRSDRAEEQLSRLTEKFEEIEQLELDEQSADELFADTEQVNLENSEETHFNERNTEESGLPKFVIPFAVIGILIVALLVANSVFDQPQQNSAQTEKEQIDLLPLELPPEKLLEQTVVVNKEKTVEQTNNNIITPATTESTGETESVDGKNTEKSGQLELVEAEATVNKQNTPEKTATEAVAMQQAEQNPDKNTNKVATPEPEVATSAPAPVIKHIEPEPVIGANKRQYITINGINLDKNVSLIVSWAGNKKEFSALKTPKQWHFVAKNKIKLHLNTGVTPQQWTVSAKNVDGSQSPDVHFEVIKPFVAKLSINKISPNPFLGSNKRQTIDIEGKGFSKQTVIELKWDKNKKHFSSRLTPSQFEYVNSNKIKLFIATGIKKRKWTVAAISPEGKTSTSSFIVVNKSSESTSSSSGNAIKDVRWLKQQADNHYTIQIFASTNKQAIDDLIKKYTLKRDVIIYPVVRDGQNWYTLTYGNYPTRQQAEAAVSALDPALTKKPWIRTFANIKEQLSKAPEKMTAAADKQKLQQAATASITAERPVSPGVDLTKKVKSQSNDEAWIWTQNPADYTIQLIALSNEAGIRAYMKKYGIEAKSTYFKTRRDDKILNVLIYGSYTDKNAAQQAAQQLTETIKDSKPWVRNFSAIHEMMPGQ